jgi:surface carbohydrate biosynthesis protein
VEIQVRELDAKLLLACVAARNRIPVVIGRIKDIHANLPAFPRGIYLSKGMGPQSVRKFEFIRGIGHSIAALDEEALVHYPPENHFTKRVSPVAGRFISDLFAWGPENEKLWRSAPQFQDSKIHLTGNPRGDLLRKELLPYFAPESQRLRDLHGDFVLINTNFPTVNSSRGIYEIDPDTGAVARPGVGARGLTPDFAENLHQHRLAHFQHFQSMSLLSTDEKTLRR